MEPEIVSAASTPPAVCIDDAAVEKSRPEVPSGLHSELHEWNQGGEDVEQAPEEVLRTCNDHTKLSFNSWPDVEHKNIEMGAKERIDKPQSDVDAAEKQLADSQEEHIDKNKMKLLESEGACLVQELHASKEEVSDPKRHLELECQADVLNKTVHGLEEKLKDLNEQAKETMEKFTKQVGACQAEVATKAKALEIINKVHSDLQLELQEVKSENQESLLAVKEQVSSLEANLKSAQDEIKSKEAAALLLQTETANSNSIKFKHSTASEERLKQREAEHQEKLKAYEKRCELLEFSLAKLQENNVDLLDSIVAARSDAEAARRKIADIELEMEVLQQMKSEPEQGSSDFQAQLRSMEDMVSKQVDSLKLKEENTDTAKEQIVHLQSMLKTKEEQLRASEDAAVSLQQQVVDLTFKEASSADQLKEVEDGSHKMQLELQLKLEMLEATVPELEEKVTQLQHLLSAAKLDSDGARSRVSELEAELASLQHDDGELSEEIKLFKDKCSQQESTAHTLSMRIKELEGSIVEFRSKTVDLSTKVATLQASLEDSQNEVTNLEMQLGLAKDSNQLLENRRIAELEKNSEEYVLKNEELQKMLAERQKEMNSFANEINELMLFIGSLESDLKSASERELLANEEKTFMKEKVAQLEALMLKLEAERSELESSMYQSESLVEKGKIDLHDAFALENELRATITSLQTAYSELQDLLIQTEEEKQEAAAQLESTMKNFSELNDQLVKERLQLQQQTATIMQENEDLRKKNVSAQEKLQVALAAAELSAKQVQQGESTLRDQVEDLKVQLKNAYDACLNAKNLEQEKGNLAQKFASAQEKLHATIEAAELSARELQAALSKETNLNSEIEDLKSQLGKAMDACCHVDQFQQTSENSITCEAHQTQIGQTVTSSRLAESKVADVGDQLLMSQLEKNDTQNPVSDLKTRLQGLDLKTSKGIKSFEQQPSDLSKMRKVDLDVQGSGKVRSRKKKGVTWETDMALKTNAIHNPQQNPAQSFNHFVAYIFIAIASLTIGFWVARNVYS
ncbi:hypothetical protein L7F22_062726 [Adiantum nelumboides]|nr:hypothetical protein [Adiantum nelumboides]